MSRTFVHTPPKFVYATDENGNIDVPRTDWYRVGKHFDQYKGWRYSSRMRNRRVRRDKSYRYDENYVMPHIRRGWWD